MSGRILWLVLPFICLSSAMLTVAPLGTAASPQTDTGTIIVRATGGSPHPGSEAAVRRLIAGLLRGQPDYGMMTPALANAVSDQLRRAEHLLLPLGDMRSVTFLRNSSLGGDEFVVTFEEGSVLVDVALNSEGKLWGSLITPMSAEQ